MAKIQFEIQIVDTHKSLETSFSIGLAIGSVQINRTLLKHDVGKFLSESNRQSIQHRLLIATTDFIGGNARQVCDAQENPVVRFLPSDFERSLLDYPVNFAALPQAKRKPRPYQSA